MLRSLYRFSKTALVPGAILATLAACAGIPGTPGPGIAPLPAPQHSWKLVWSDEFDNGVIDPAKWWRAVSCSGGGNNEAQCFTDRRENAHVDDGSLRIVGREENFSGPALDVDHPDYDINDRSAIRSYTSASLRSRNLFDFRYGRIEVRAKLPSGRGMWPSIWMLPTDEVYGGWPRSGEIDIMEAVNLDPEADAHKLIGTLHYGLMWPQWSAIGKPYKTRTSLTGDFHTYMIEWEADEIRWYFDGIHYQTQTSKGWYNYLWGGQESGFQVPNPRAPFDQEFYLLLHLAIGGNMPGPPDTGWEREREYLIDYVRIYQCDSGNADGTGCANASDAPIDPTITPTPDSGRPKVNRFSLFDEGPARLTLNTAEGEFNDSLVIASWEASAGNVVFGTPDIGGANGRVLELVFNGAGNVSLSPAAAAEVRGIGDGLSLFGGSGWERYGTLEFDLFVESIDADTRLVAKLDSGYPNLGQMPIETPAVGEWTRVRIRLSDLLANPLPGGSGLNLDRVINPFVIEATGTAKAKIRLDNISLACVVNEYYQPWQADTACWIDPVFVMDSITGTTEVFREDFTNWQPGDCCGGGKIRVVTDDVEPSRGKVIEFSYDSDETVTFLYSKRPMDFSALAGGTLEFDLMVVREPDLPAARDPWKIAVNCGHPCGSGDIPLSASLEGRAPTVGVWQHYSFQIDDLVERGLKLEKVDAPLVIFPSWGNQQGAVFRVDNLVVKAAR